MVDIKLYAAPMEGITTYVWRQVHRELFGGAEKYYTPFISPNGNFSFQSKELAEISRGEEDLVPQLLANRGEYFVWAGKELAARGFREINLNLGCPSATVVAKHKGSGMLSDLESLERTLDETFNGLHDMKISIKTRVGRYSAEEWPAILELLNRYPIAELTVHPRIQKEFYQGRAHRELFAYTAEHTAIPLVYNGDVLSPDDPALQGTCPVMIGRGMVMDPALLRRCHGGPAATRQELTDYHDRLLEAYRATLSGDVPVLHRMRLLWTYLSQCFEGSERYLRSIYKAKNLAAYLPAARAILGNCPFNE